MKDWIRKFKSLPGAAQGALIALTVVIILAIFARDADSAGPQVPRQVLPDGSIMSNTFCNGLEPFAEVLSLPYENRRDKFVEHLEAENCVLLPTPVQVFPKEQHGEYAYKGADGQDCMAMFVSLKQTERAIKKGLKPWYTFVEACKPGAPQKQAIKEWMGSKGSAHT